MISYSRTSFWQRPWFTIVCMGAAAAAVVVWWMWHGREQAGAKPEQTSLQAQSARPEQAARLIAGTPEAVARAGLRQPVVHADGRPADFSAEEWSALKDAMSQSDQPEAELQRVVAYLRFQKRFDHWRNLKDSPDVGLRRLLAASLVDQVPDRLKAGEVTMSEAQLLMSALWSDIESDENSRRQRIADSIKILQAVAPAPSADQTRRESDQLAEYKRRESAIVSEYQARPQAQRDPAWLEAQLDEARRSVYGSQ